VHDELTFITRLLTDLLRDGQVGIGVRLLAGVRDVLCSAASIPTLGSIQPLIQWVSAPLSSGGKASQA
jgi:hypothetical protein